MSKLGLEAQRAAVADYQPIAEYVEVESGSHNDHKRRDEAEIAAEAIQLGDVGGMGRIARREFDVAIPRGGGGTRAPSDQQADQGSGPSR